MIDPSRLPPNSDDELVEAAERALRFQYRALLGVVALLAVCVVVFLAAHGTAWSRWGAAATGWIVGLGVPWLGWHLRIPYAARVVAPIFQLTGLDLHGQDPRGSLWTLAELPVLFFLAGWGIDICLRQRGKTKSVIARVIFCLFWIYLCRGTFESPVGWPEKSLDLTGMLAGIAAVWLPRGALIPHAVRVGTAGGVMVKRGLYSAGVWLMTRIGIALLILLPSLIYLDLLDLPPLLRAEWEGREVVGNESDRGVDDEPMLFWKREVRALTGDDFKNLDVRIATADSMDQIITAVRTLRLNPRSADALKLFDLEGSTKLSNPAELRELLGVVPVFYIDHLGSGDDRVTSGFWSVPGGKWAKWGEVLKVSESDIELTERAIQRSTFIILAGSVLILLLLGGPSGGVPAAWWIAIFIAGTHLGWVSDSLDLVIERLRFVIWRDYSNDRAGATFFGLHTVLVFFVEISKWLTSNLVAQTGIWVSLCWPARPGPLIRSGLDRFWLQTGKIFIISIGLYLLRLAFFLLGTGSAELWFYVWFLIFPLLLVGSGIWMRNRIRPEIGASHSHLLPNAGKAVAIAFLLRGWVPLLSNLETNASLPPFLASCTGTAAVLLAVFAAILLIVALERGTFLSPPHVDGQLWLLGAASIPFVENVVGDPVSAFIENSNLFLGSTVAWLAFGASLWVIGPIFSFIGDFLSNWRAKGLNEIAEFDGEIVASARSGEAMAKCESLFAALEIVDPQLWCHCGDGWFRCHFPKSNREPSKLVSRSLAGALGGIEGSLRLEEMRLEWRWAAYHGELDHWFAEGGDILLIPASRDGELLGIFCAPDLPENRFLLRPAVSNALAAALATALLFSPEPEDQDNEGAA